ncbi:MAG: tetratricopeptide repeat protein, partial [Desulfobacterales bacterium]|nr:tetratricopeptide repeat protein [Desulfobacterales bacterium]
WGSLGSLLQDELERYEEAEQAYRKAIEIDPDYTWAWGCLGFLLHDNLHRYEEAEQAYRKVVEINPNDAYIWSRLGSLLHYHLQHYEEAEQAYRKAVKIDPELVLALGGLGFLLHDNLHRYEEAEQVYKKAIEIEPTDDFLWTRLIELQMDAMCNPEVALETAQEFLEASGRSTKSLNNLASSFFTCGWHDYFEHAEVWSREAVEKEPDEPEYQYTLASILGAVDKWAEALEISPLFLVNEGFLEKRIGQVIDFFINAAASGYVEESLRVLEQHLDKPALEPLITGLKIFLGEKVRTAQEIMEIGEDVAKRIHERVAALQDVERSTTSSPKMLPKTEG